MKKIFSLFLSVAIITTALLFSASAPANDNGFSIRGGIKVGMSIAEVKGIEGIPSFESEDELEYIVDIQGLDKAQITYYFSKEKVLNEIVYVFRDISDTSTIADYNYINEILKEKYGEPENMNTGEQEVIGDLHQNFTIKNNGGIDVVASHLFMSESPFMRHMLIYKCTLYEDPASSF